MFRWAPRWRPRCPAKPKRYLTWSSPESRHAAVRWEFCAVGAKNSRADRYLPRFCTAESNRRRGHLQEVPVVLILQHRKCVGPHIIKNHRQSGSAPPVNGAATSAVGLFPTAKLVSGKTAPEGAAVKLPPEPKLFESSDNVTGKRSPTKNVAGLLSCARSRTSRPLRTSESESEKSTVAPGVVSKNVDNPPPNRTNGGMLENPCP